MRKIAVCIAFSDDAQRTRITQKANALGFHVDYFATAEDILPTIEDYEIIYGHPSPEIVTKATNLKWLCSDFAGIEKYLPDGVFYDNTCILSNSSGAYGPTISEHIIMVLLMLLRRMPEYEADLAERKWTFYSPIRSIIGSHFVLLGTGDIGSNTARRLKALGATVTGVCRSGVSDEPAFDRVVPISELDRVLPLPMHSSCPCLQRRRRSVFSQKSASRFCAATRTLSMLAAAARSTRTHWLTH